MGETNVCCRKRTFSEPTKAGKGHSGCHGGIDSNCAVPEGNEEGHRARDGPCSESWRCNGLPARHSHRGTSWCGGHLHDFWPRGDWRWKCCGQSQECCQGTMHGWCQKHSGSGQSGLSQASWSELEGSTFLANYQSEDVISCGMSENSPCTIRAQVSLTATEQDIYHRGPHPLRKNAKERITASVQRIESPEGETVPSRSRQACCWRACSSLRIGCPCLSPTAVNWDGSQQGQRCVCSCRLRINSHRWVAINIKVSQTVLCICNTTWPRVRLYRFLVKLVRSWKSTPFPGKSERNLRNR